PAGSAVDPLPAGAPLAEAGGDGLDGGGVDDGVTEEGPGRGGSGGACRAVTWPGWRPNAMAMPTAITAIAATAVSTMTGARRPRKPPRRRWPTGSAGGAGS